MKKLVFVFILAGCASQQPMYQCKFDPLYPNRGDNCRDREFTRVVKPNLPPVPEPNDPPVVKDPDVCDGGARACHDGEQPTGTQSDPTKYLEK